MPIRYSVSILVLVCLGACSSQEDEPAAAAEEAPAVAPAPAMPTAPTPVAEPAPAPVVPEAVGGEEEAEAPEAPEQAAVAEGDDEEESAQADDSSGANTGPRNLVPGLFGPNGVSPALRNQRLPRVFRTGGNGADQAAGDGTPNANGLPIPDVFAE